MSDLLQIFTGNPLTTFIGKKIEAATRPELESEDWALNIEICDIINENDDDAKDAARAIKKRLQQIEQDPNFVITNRTLTLLDTCVSNCSHRFHSLVMTKDFIQDLVKLIGPKNNPPIELQERVLGLIERWADAFRNQPDLGGVVSVYNELKTRGVTFPPRDPGSHVPIQTPQRSVPATPRHETRPLQPAPAPMMPLSRPGTGSMMAAPQAGPGATANRQQPLGQVVLEGEGYNKISQDLIVVQTSIDMFNDVLKELESPNSEDTARNLADELSVTCRQMKDRIVDLIERVANEDLTIELLRLNDEFNTIFTRYESLLQSRARTGDVKSSTRTPSQLPVATVEPSEAPARQVDASSNPRLPGVSSRTLNELSLIDFNLASSSGDATSRQQQPSESNLIRSQAHSTANRTTPVTADPFDTSNILARDGQSLADELRQVNLSGGKVAQTREKTSGLPDEVSSVREQDFAEIENWLSTDSGRNLTSIAGDMPSMEPVSITNPDFDNFIASRAMAGSTSSTSGQTNRDQQKKPEPSA